MHMIVHVHAVATVTIVPVYNHKALLKKSGDDNIMTQK